MQCCGRDFRDCETNELILASLKTSPGEVKSMLTVRYKRLEERERQPAGYTARDVHIFIPQTQCRPNKSTANKYTHSVISQKKHQKKSVKKLIYYWICVPSRNLNMTSSCNGITQTACRAKLLFRIRMFFQFFSKHPNILHGEACCFSTTSIKQICKYSNRFLNQTYR